jgi:complement component 1 Q subcomponent-binding protein, mitochondrial
MKREPNVCHVHENNILTFPPRIRLTFSIADLNSIDQDPDQDPDQYADDKAQFDESGEDLLPDTQSGGAQSKGTINQGRTKGGNFSVQPEDQVGAADESEALEDESGDDDLNQDPSFPARVNITIEKPGQGALQIETIAQDGEIVIENTYYFSKAELANAKTADLDWSKRNLYVGPPFGNLDEELQVLLERYLEERGINTALALWIPEYIDLKEQREYLNWLSSMYM